MHIEPVCGEGESVGLLQLIPHSQPALGIVQHLRFVKFEGLMEKSRPELLQTAEGREEEHPFQ